MTNNTKNKDELTAMEKHENLMEVLWAGIAFVSTMAVVIASTSILWKMIDMD